MSKVHTDVYLLGDTDRILAIAYIDDEIASTRVCDIFLVYLKNKFRFNRDLRFDDGKLSVNPNSIESKIESNNKALDILKLFFTTKELSTTIDEIKKIDGFIDYKVEQYIVDLEAIFKLYNNGKKIISKDTNKSRPDSHIKSGKGARYLTAKKVATITSPSFSIKKSNKDICCEDESVTRIFLDAFNDYKYVLVYSKNKKDRDEIVEQYIDINDDIHHVVRYDLNRQNLLDNDYSIYKLQPVNTNIVGDYQNEDRTFQKLLKNSNKNTIIVFDGYDNKHEGIINDLKKDYIGDARVIILSNKEISKTKYNRVKTLNLDDYENWRNYLAALPENTNYEEELKNYSGKNEALMITSLFLVKDTKHDKEKILKLSNNNNDCDRVLKKLIKKGVVKDDDDKLRLDYDYEETIIKQDMYSTKDVSKFLSSDSVLKVFKNMLITGIYRDINLLFFTINQSNSISLNNNVTRRYLFTKEIIEEIEKIIEQNNKDVNGKLVRLLLVPSHVEEIIFNDMQFIISNLPKHRSLLLCNNNSIVLFDYDNKEKYVIYGKFNGKYHIAGHFGIFKDDLELPEFVIDERVENDIRNFKKETSSLLNTGKYKTLYDLDNYQNVVDEALKKAIKNYQYVGTINQLEEIIKYLNEEIICGNMKKNFELDDIALNENNNIFKEAILDIDRKLQSVDYLLSFPKIGLRKSFVNDYQTWMAYHHGVNEWSKGNIDKAIVYYEDGLGIAEDYLHNEQYNEDELFNLYNNIAICANLLANCYYEKMKESNSIEYFDYAKELIEKAISNQKRFCEWKETSDGRYALLASMYNNKGRICSLVKEYYDEARNMFDECYRILSSKEMNKRVADVTVAYCVNLNNLIDKLEINKLENVKKAEEQIKKNIEINDKEILKRYNIAFKLIEEYKLNLSVKADTLCNYVKHYIFVKNNVRNEYKKEITKKDGVVLYKINKDDLYNIKNSLDVNNPRHVLRNKEIIEVLSALNK